MLRNNAQPAQGHNRTYEQSNPARYAILKNNGCIEDYEEEKAVPG